MIESIQFRARQSSMSFAGDTVELYAFTEGESCSCAEPLVMKPADPLCAIGSFCRIRQEQAQVLMDDLWLVGLRPSEGTGSAGSLKATQNHLSDLKTILFHKLGIKNETRG